MRWSDISWVPPTRRLRQFAGLWLAVFGGLAIWDGLVRGNTTTAIVLVVLAVTIGTAGLVWPRSVREIYVGWTVVVFPIGWQVSTLMLAAMYYGVITVVAVIFRLIGRDALNRRFEPEAPTYWQPK